MTTRLRREEPEPVYRELVDGLADNVVPMVILCAMMILSGAHILSIVSSPTLFAATLVSAVTILVKIAVILYHRRHRAFYHGGPIGRVRRLETVHAVTTIAVCLSVSAFSVVAYLLPEAPFHLLPVCICFGYSAGLIARVSIRPHIAGSAILSIGLPSVLTMIWLGGDYLFVALIWGVFVGAGLQSVGFVYATARRAVTLRLDMETQARCDPLTGVSNRLGLREAFEALVRSEPPAIAVHAFDLDGFKGVNDRLGHAAGDRLLALLAARVQQCVPGGTIVARTGGDEFVVVQTGEDAAARALAECLHERLTQPFDLGDERIVSLGLSLGYAIGGDARFGLEDMIQRADSRSYAAKRAGGGIKGPGDPIDAARGGQPHPAKRHAHRAVTRRA